MRWIVPVVAVLLAMPAPAEAGNPRRGKEVYDTHCASCHGIDGTAAMVGVPSFRKGERLERPNPVLQKTIMSGRRMMPAWRGLLTLEQISDVVAFIRTLRR